VDISKMRVVYQLPGMEEVEVQRGIEYLCGEAGPLTLDLYRPPAVDQLRAAVVIVLGYPDVGVRTPFGCQFREMGMVVSWGQLFAVSGMFGVVYETRNPEEDVHAVLSYLHANGPTLGIDPARIGVWTCSGNAPVALSVLMEGKARCGVIFYGFTLDLEGATGVATAALQYRFSNPTQGKRVEDLPATTALFLARAGQDQIPGLNQALEHFLAAAVRCNLPVTFVNHPTGPHGFDYMDDSPASKQIIGQAIQFLQARTAS
jgi:dienelactone hydrolase